MKTRYLITKREPCDKPSQTHDPETHWCPSCQGYGYIDTMVDLVEVLRQVSVPAHLSVSNAPGVTYDTYPLGQAEISESR